MAYTDANQSNTTPSSSFDAAQDRLTRALDRLQYAVSALSESRPSSTEWQSRAAAIENERQILKEENEKLNHLLHDAINKYARLYKTTTTVAERLDSVILRLENVMELEAS